MTNIIKPITLVLSIKTTNIAPLITTYACNQFVEDFSCSTQMVWP